MKKLVILGVLVTMACAMAFASPYVIAKRSLRIDNPNEVATSTAITPSQKITSGMSKFAGTFIDSSRNQFGIYASENEPIAMFNDSLAFAYRQWPTSSGRVACASSGDFGANWSIDYDINTPLTTSRYPNAIGGPAPYISAPCLEGGVFGSGMACYNVGGWLTTMWDPYVQVFPDLTLYRVTGRYLNDGTVFFIGSSGAPYTVYMAQYSGDMTTELMAPTTIWDLAAGDTASSVNIDYRYGRLIEMATWNNYQYVKSDDNGATGFTIADTIGFNLTGLADTLIWDSRFVINNDTLPVMLLSVTANADTMTTNWEGCYLHDVIICALPNGEHVTVYDGTGSNGTGEGVGGNLAFARGQGDTLIAGWMHCSDVTGWDGGTLNWNIMGSMSCDGGHTWGAPILMANSAIAECFPHFANEIGSDRQVHMIYGTNNSTTTNVDIYWEINLGPAAGVATYNYWAAVPIDSFPKYGVEGNTTSTPTYKLALNQSNPNPARTNASISFSLPKAGNYSLKVYNIAGQVIRTLDGKGQAGQNTVTWNGMDNNGRQAANGVYLYNLNAFGSSATKKLVVVR